MMNSLQIEKCVLETIENAISSIILEKNEYLNISKNENDKLILNNLIQKILSDFEEEKLINQSSFKFNDSKNKLTIIYVPFTTIKNEYIPYKVTHNLFLDDYNKSTLSVYDKLTNMLRM